MIRARLGHVRTLIREALKKGDAERVAAALQNAVGKQNLGVSASADTMHQMQNIFVRRIHGDEKLIQDTLVATAEKLGWTLLSKSDRGRGVVWWFEPKAETKGPVPTSKLPPVMWHTTIAKNVPSILETGLTPRTRAEGYAETLRQYAPRVYLGTSEAGAKATVNRPGDWRMLKIDASKLPKNLKFYVDQEFGYRKDGMPIAVYTMDAIPPSAIEIVEPVAA